MPPSNMAIQPGKNVDDPDYKKPTMRTERPPMKQEEHPDHNMPPSTHNGVIVKSNQGMSSE